MKCFLICVILGLVCALFVIGGVAPAVSAASAESMYQVQEVVGTLLSAQRMYDSGQVILFSGQLRVDEGAAALKPGTNCAVRYPVPSTTLPEFIPGSGDQIKAKLYQQLGSNTWEAAQAPMLLGRGELLRPGRNAAFDSNAPKARVLVKMLAPLTDCHAKTVELLKELAAREPERVRVQIFDTRTPSGRDEMRSERLNCATVLVNNRYEFEIGEPFDFAQGKPAGKPSTQPAGKRKVYLHHRPNDSQSPYNSEDVITVVEQELRRLYP